MAPAQVRDRRSDLAGQIFLDEGIDMMKLRRKIRKMGLPGFRSLEGASGFATIRSFLSAAKKQGAKIIEARTGDPTNLMKFLRLA